MDTVVGITGASGVVYGVRLLETLPSKKTLICSAEALKLLELEVGIGRDALYAKADAHYENDDMFSSLASGSVVFDSLVIAPCSMSTMSKIACGIADNLITRVASVALKERRTLLLLIRETPISSIHLANLERLALAGATIMPASPAFYPEPKSVQQMVDFVVGRVLDQLGAEHDLYRRWSGREVTGSRGPRRRHR
jgi:4-hydroxy-3-polyprenylbenzoate decarboxylase